MGKRYDLPIEEDERRGAEADLRAALELTAEIYRAADKGEASNVVLSGEVMAQIFLDLVFMAFSKVETEHHHISYSNILRNF